MYKCNQYIPIGMIVMTKNNGLSDSMLGMCEAKNEFQSNFYSD